VALVIVAAELWTAFDLLSDRGGDRGPVPLAAASFAGAVFLMALTGGIVAGIHAGFAYNTFPLMNGRLIPAEVMAITPWYRNFFYNMATVQLVHRTIAWLLILSGPLLWIWVRRSSPAGAARAASNLVSLALAVQVGLGIATLLSGVALPLAAGHQAGAVALFASALWLAHTWRPARAEPAPGSVPHAA
jgi:cytochrome c oxidase assembly protein subunit 15